MKLPITFPQVVAPKKETLGQAEGIYKTTMGKLKVKQEELKEITDRLDALKADLDGKQQEKKVR